MKKILFSMIAICAFAFQADAQRQYQFTTAEDTVTNAETSYIYPADATTALTATSFREFGALDVTIKYDSLSGNPAGTAILQYCYDEACNKTFDAATISINGPTATSTRTTVSEFTPLKWRVKMTTTGTQTSRIQVFAGWKRKT